MSNVVSMSGFKGKKTEAKEQTGVTDEFFKMREDEEFQDAMTYVISVMSDIIESNFDFKDSKGELVMPDEDDIIMICESICSMIMRRKGVSHPYQLLSKKFAEAFKDGYDFE